MADAPSSGSITRLVRGQLISQHYLTHQLLNRDDWKAVGEDPRATEIETLFEKVRAQLSKNKPTSKGSNEDAVRDQFLNRVFDDLPFVVGNAVELVNQVVDLVVSCPTKRKTSPWELIGNRISGTRDKQSSTGKP
jgi:hypothetical protein